MPDLSENNKKEGEEGKQQKCGGGGVKFSLFTTDIIINNYKCGGGKIKIKKENQKRKVN